MNETIKVLNQILSSTHLNQSGHTRTIAWLLTILWLGTALLLSACQPVSVGTSATMEENAGPQNAPEMEVTELPTATPFPTRPSYSPAELVDYTVQTGDSLPVLAIRFHTTIAEIREANPIIPDGATTLPPGMPMQIPIYYQSFWGSPFQIIPDSLFVNGPAMVDFDTAAFVDGSSGWLAEYSEYAAGANRSAAGIVDYVAQNFSISPQVLLALLDYQTGALSQDSLPVIVDSQYPLGHQSRNHRGLYLQLVWAANFLNNGYYAWRTGNLIILELPDGTIERPDPWQNAATVTLQYYFSQNFGLNEYRLATGPDGFARTFQDLFGDPWEAHQPHIPGSLTQPDLRLPFEAGKTWAYTGGPHTGWGTGEPWAAIDFAPPATAAGCIPSNEWNTAMADGVVARVDVGVLELDLDGDGDPRTGWVIFYLHVATREKVPLGTVLSAGDPIGHPSCEGGTSTGTHIHIARKYNGEWIPADGILPFNLEGWVAHNGTTTYRGTLTRFSNTIVANSNATQDSYITAEISSEE